MHLAAQVVLYVEVFKCLIAVVSLWQSAFWWVGCCKDPSKNSGCRWEKCNTIGYGRIWTGELLCVKGIIAQM